MDHDAHLAVSELKNSKKRDADPVQANPKPL